MNEYLAFQLHNQVSWEVVLVYSVLYITAQYLFLLVIDIEQIYVLYHVNDYHLMQWTLNQNISEVHFVCIYNIILVLLFSWFLQFLAN